MAMDRNFNQINNLIVINLLKNKNKILIDERYYNVQLIDVWGRHLVFQGQGY